PQSTAWTRGYLYAGSLSEAVVQSAPKCTRVDGSRRRWCVRRLAYQRNRAAGLDAAQSSTANRIYRTVRHANENRRITLYARLTKPASLADSTQKRIRAGNPASMVGVNKKTS